MKESNIPIDDDFMKIRAAEIESEAKRQEKAGLEIWGNHFYKNNPK